jgi:hypothetical protein
VIAGEELKVPHECPSIGTRPDLVTSHREVQCGMVWHGGMVWYGMVWYGMVWYGMVWYGMVWYGMVWYGMAWYGIVPLMLFSAVK